MKILILLFAMITFMIMSSDPRGDDSNMEARSSESNDKDQQQTTFIEKNQDTDQSSSS
ncbi:ABZJ_00068 family colistin stress protein [Acinetobacter stercoris]|uniref:Uncharacterized protein n=1 Tax=Acinetobacter stercoris TaxID=2126983 RepID=A0A2U3N3M0_9GAMM|nr:hypothetical protein [Acinetobacter stercoris]SPL72233.1 hypothetical protein KPC_3411 [Acinetobacter stercoris]